MNKAKPNVRGTPRPTGDDRVTDGWTRSETPPPAGRNVLVSHMKAPAHRGEIDGPSLPGIDIHDLQIPGHERYIDQAVLSDGFSLEFAAFLIGGFFVDPQQAGEAFNRIRGLVAAADPNAIEVEAAHQWLVRTFAPPSTDEASNVRFIITPDSLFLALHDRPDAPRNSLDRLLFSAHRIAQHRLAQQADELALAKTKWNIDEDDNSGSTSNSRTALYLLAVATGTMTAKGNLSGGVRNIQDALKVGHDAAKAVEPTIGGKPTFSSDSISDYLRSGAKALGIDPAGKPGRPNFKK